MLTNLKPVARTMQGQAGSGGSDGAPICGLGGETWISLMKPFADIALFLCFSFVAMLVPVMAPGDTGRVVVFLGKNDRIANIYPLLDLAGGDLVEVVGQRTFVVESTKAGFVSALYQGGAFLVVSAQGFYGCDAIASRGQKQRRIYREFAEK